MKLVQSSLVVLVGVVGAWVVDGFTVSTRTRWRAVNVGSGRTSSSLWMGWGPDPVWEGVTVVSNEAASKSCVAVTVEISPETAKGFVVPGQYCQVKASQDEDAKPSFLAVASPPNAASGEFEFLIKRTDNNDWITEAAPGTVLQCSQIMGGGFPLAEELEGIKYDFPTQNILLFAAGSGIAPIRSAIESGQLQAGEGGRTARLYYGVRSTDDVAYVEKFAKWESFGVEVVPIVSQPTEGYQGRSGYVQTALEEDGVAIPRNSGALMCGMKGMAEAVKANLVKAGVFEGRILTNF